ncbi:MAG TPA: HD domain-containing phosphohydrolase [Polyangiaceae bacterium]|jgi:HD-GYP domain-containing protein (c-di-GMP phosphodiesterase class II)
MIAAGEPGITKGGYGPADAIYATLKSDPRLSNELITRPHPLLVLLAREDYALVFASAAVWDHAREVLKPLVHRFAEASALLVLVGRPEDPALIQALSRGLGAVLPAHPTGDELVIAVHRAFELLDAKARAETRGRWLTRYRYESSELVSIARAMTTERDVDRLLGVILEKSRFVSGADAGSIYVVEGEESRRMLRFKLTQNDSVTFDSREFTIPVNNRSMAGSAAHDKKTINIADVYELPPSSPFAFDRSFDVRIGYRTKSVLAVPLVSQKGDVIGVIQLINKKKDPDKKLFTQADVAEQVIPFDGRSEELLGLVAAQAGVSLENALLYEEIRKLFEGFVKASVEAIESRDPTTSGHSRRVADLTVGLAKVVDRESAGAYKDAFFTREDLQELEYASLLHDFGKIGVREKVLVKAKKLYDERLELIRARFDFVARSAEADLLARKVTALERGASRDEVRAIDEELLRRKQGVEDAYEAILAANEPTVMAAGDFERIEAIARETFHDLRGGVQQLLTSEEIAALSVKRGSLTEGEFDEIRSHVSHTFRFLSRIPWGKALSRVPLIAGAHHERINGTGYPNRLRAEEIPVQSKMMSIADIFDALTASDRPYKKAVPLERAIDILEYSVRDGHLDPELVRIFRDARVWEKRD